MSDAHLPPPCAVKFCRHRAGFSHTRFLPEFQLRGTLQEPWLCKIDASAIQLPLGPFSRAHRAAFRERIADFRERIIVPAWTIHESNPSSAEARTFSGSMCQRVLSPRGETQRAQHTSRGR